LTQFANNARLRTSPNAVNARRIVKDVFAFPTSIIFQGRATHRIWISRRRAVDSFHSFHALFYSLIVTREYTVIWIRVIYIFRLISVDERKRYFS